MPTRSDYNDMSWGILEVMRKLDMPATNIEINRALADHLHLDEEARTAMHKNGTQTNLAYHAAWCRTGLRLAGAIENTGRARWRTTESGSAMSREEMERRIGIAKGITPKADDESGENTTSAVADESAIGPGSWQEMLIALLGRLSPAAFERLAMRVLIASGFQDVEVLGRSGDDGIDGVGIYRPSLISFPVYFQCKRYAGAVGAGAVRDFRGAMQGRGEHGLLLTTGTFTSPARAEAARDGATTIDLLDGDDLCGLLRELRLGVNVRTITIEDVTVEEAYFYQFEEVPQ